MHTYRISRSVLAAAVAITVSACGGGSSKSDPTLQGLAATGAALANATVTAKCITGAPLAGTTANNGSFNLILSGGQTLPCLLQVIGGNPSITLHSFATEAGRVNVTPLTDLVVTKALGRDPSLGFAGFTSSTSDAIKGGLDAAKIYVNTQLTAIAGATTATDIMTGAFKVGDADDKLLDTLAAAIKVAGKSQTTLELGAALGAALAPLVQAPPAVSVTPPVVVPPIVTPPPPIVVPPIVAPTAAPAQAAQFVATGTLTGLPSGIVFNAAVVSISPLFESYGSPPMQDASITIENTDKSFVIIVDGEVTAGGLGGPNALGLNAQSTNVASGLEWNTSPLCFDFTFPKNCKVQAGVVIDRIGKKITFTNVVLDLPFGDAAVAIGKLTLNGIVAW